jgi:tetratricopeptide (TPR) repeat protein
MKSGLWILIVVMIAGLAVGYALKGRIQPPTLEAERAQLKAITDLTDPEAKIDRLQGFVAGSPANELKARAYSYIARELLEAVKDTTRFVGFARQTIEKETDPESKALMYYRLYNLKIETKPDEAALLGTELVKVPITAGWIYNHIGYDLAERNRDLDLALALCTRAVELAQERGDSAQCLDSRGFTYYRRGQYREAIADFEAARPLYDEPEPEALLHLGAAYLKAGEADKGFDTFRSVLLLAEDEQARAAVDSMMTTRRYTPRKKQAFEQALWQERLAAARPAIGFTMTALDGSAQTFDPTKGEIVLLNFTSPT